MTEKFLRGKGPLTMWRGANGASGGYLYRGGLLDPGMVDKDDTARLVVEGFLEWVVRDGEQFRLAEDTDTGSKGDPVTLGDNGFPPANEVDNGTVNSQVLADAEASRERIEAAKKADAEAADKSKADDDLAERRAVAQSKLPPNGGVPDGRASKDVLVEWLAAVGYSYNELSKQEPAELKALIKQRQQS